MNFPDKFQAIDLEIHGVRLPEITIDKDDYTKYKIKTGVSNYEFLRELCLAGFDKLKLEKGSKEYKEYSDRVKYELSIFKELNFTDYILLVWDVINFCDKNNIPTGLGRGSAAGSLVLYLIRVTKINPIKHGLYFERFVSKVRAKSTVVNGVTYLDGSLMCDVDMDICYYRRQEVIKYIEEKFSGRTAKILTFNTLSSKLLIKEVGKIAGEKSENEMTMVSKLIPKDAGMVMDLEEAYAQEEELRDWCDKNKFVYDICLKLKGLIKNKGVHPSGQLIAHGKLEEVCPIELSSEKSLVSSFDMDWVSMFSVKLDLLGLRGISVVDDVCKTVGISIEDIDLNDPIIYQNLQKLESQHGLFQIEADLAHRVVNKVRPKNLEELSGVLALARPGAMSFIDQYARYTNHGTYEPIHSFFDDILKSTGGVCLYQEQLMQMVHKIGFSLDDAEQVRRCVGKKKIEEMATWEKKIQDKITERGLDPEISKILWEIAEASAKYQFNKSHSVCYAALAAITVYLKNKSPHQFFLSLLKMSLYEPDTTSEIYKIQKEMPAYGIKLLHPNLIKSSANFKIEGKDIRYGFLPIKGIAAKSIHKLEEFRGEYSNKFEVYEAAKKAEIPIGVLAALIQAGCFEDKVETEKQDKINRFLKKSISRSFNVYQAQLWNVLTDKEKKLALQIGEECEYNVVSVLKKLSETKNDKGTLNIKASRVETIRKKAAPFTEIFAQNKQFEALANWWYETKLLGYSYSASLSEIFSSGNHSYTPLNKVIKMSEAQVYFAGIIGDKVKVQISRAGKKYVKLKVMDEGASVDVMIFERLLNTMEIIPKEDDIILVKGIVKEDGAVFADLIGIQSAKIYTKHSDLARAVKQSEKENPEEITKP